MLHLAEPGIVYLRYHATVKHLRVAESLIEVVYRSHTGLFVLEKLKPFVPGPAEKSLLEG